MLKINIETIPHDEHRYPLIGDYWDDPDGSRQLRISEMGDPRFEFLVAMHELIEQELCRLRGIAEPDVAAFDIRFEEERERGLHGPEDEPGDAPDAPYRLEHAFACKLEQIIGDEMGIDWPAYEAALRKLDEE